ncbi:MAG: hypothetical protein EPO68_08210 [Planctomycetota bacterium]|nr:MAG: hypothetical protein EPO68_08210 [Planctomycetota bacterium]
MPIHEETGAQVAPTSSSSRHEWLVEHPADEAEDKREWYRAGAFSVWMNGRIVAPGDVPSISEPEPEREYWCTTRENHPIPGGVARILPGGRFGLEIRRAQPRGPGHFETPKPER